MQPAYKSPLRRPDTLLGVCQALADDMGFNPLWLRLVFAAGLFWQPTLVIGVYLALGALVLVSRLLFPDTRRVPAEAAASPQAAEVAETEEKLPLAA